MTGASRRSTRGRIKSSSSSSSPSADDSICYPPSICRGKGKELVSIGAFKANLKILIGLIILGIVVIYFVINWLVSHGLLYDESQKPRVITPFPAPKLMDLSMFQGEHKESLYWGTYRPHVYFGVRARTPMSLVAGLMWLGVKDEMYVMRHFCDNSDDLSTFGWREHWSSALPCTTYLLACHSLMYLKRNIENSMKSLRKFSTFLKSMIQKHWGLARLQLQTCLVALVTSMVNQKFMLLKPESLDNFLLYWPAELYCSKPALFS